MHSVEGGANFMRDETHKETLCIYDKLFFYRISVHEVVIKEKNDRGENNDSNGHYTGVNRPQCMKLSNILVSGVHGHRI